MTDEQRRERIRQTIESRLDQALADAKTALWSGIEFSVSLAMDLTIFVADNEVAVRARRLRKAVCN